MSAFLSLRRYDSPVYMMSWLRRRKSLKYLFVGAAEEIGRASAR